MLCSDLLTSHHLRDGYDSRDAQQDAILKHLLSGMCASKSSCLCQLLAHDTTSAAHLSYHLRTLLSDTRQDTTISLEGFLLCCASVGLGAVTNSHRELRQKLQQWLTVTRPHQ
jgi:hypothetical protein